MSASDPTAADGGDRRFRNIWGVLFGVAFITLIGEVLKPLGSYDVIAYGALLITVVIFFPRGLLDGIGTLIVNLQARRGTT